MEYISILKDDVDLSKSHRYLRLPHPRTGQPQLYLPHTSSAGKESILETVKISGSQRRTWFKGDHGIDAGTILVHYPVDPLFLVIPIILSLTTSSNAQSFQPLSDILSTAAASSSFSLPEPFTTPTKPGQSSTSSKHNGDLGTVLSFTSVKRVFKACCEKKAIPSVQSSAENPTPAQIYYRPSVAIVLNHLKKKVDHLSSPEQYEKFDHLVRGLGKDGLLDGEGDMDVLRNLAKRKAVCEHLSQWLPPSVTAQLAESYNFTPLSTHLANRSAAAIAASVPPSNTSNKDPTAKGTKRKAPPTSKGVEALKKVNTNSMSKLTSFFKPKEGKKK
ncbi:uncharacterized protein IL334_007334 [Kwoniella shivajii]|uniref:Ribonuclease H2 subunit B n=1 Tax=Kwoniella shivajii TaxID=564305 RepID=A0ABZ1D966_9TREE|nr:hypothetical protein IL334_007334 [Kwoniella shivajii]